MTVYFQFNKDIGGKVICMENLCALNPLDQFFIDLNLVKTLFYDYPVGDLKGGASNLLEEVTEDDDLEEDNNSLIYLEKSNLKRLRPLFKKVVSQEISKLISKGIHNKVSIREMIANQDLESKVYHIMGV